MKIKYYLYNTFIVGNERIKTAIDSRYCVDFLVESQLSEGEVSRKAVKGIDLHSFI